MNGMIRILHVFYGLGNGGAEMRTLDVMRNIDRQRYHFQFVVVSGRVGVLDDQVRSLGGKVHYCRLGPSFGRQFRRVIRDERIDVVHCHLSSLSGYILSLAAREEVPKRIVHFRIANEGHKWPLWRALRMAIMRRWVTRHATHVLAVGRWAMASMWPTWQTDSRCTVIHNGLDIGKFRTDPDRAQVRQDLGIPPECRFCIHVGRFSPSKNHQRLLAIFAALHKKAPAWRLVLVGSDRGAGIERQMRSRIEALGLSQAVTLVGDRDDVPRLLQAADLMLFPSIREGVPGAVLEACAAGLPVVATDLPGIGEIADHFPNVQCQSLRTTDDEWAEAAMAMALDNDDIGETFHCNALRWFMAGPFTMKGCVARLQGIWDPSDGKDDRLQRDVSRPPRSCPAFPHPHITLGVPLDPLSEGIGNHVQR